MTQFFCNINSAVISKEQKSFLIPPICLDGKMYILDDKKLYYVLEKIEKIKDFLNYTRTNGLKQTRKWLQKNKLINEGFLENVSRYTLDSDIKKAHKYYFFLKDENYNPYIPDTLFKNYFKSASLYNFLQENNVAFNIFIEKQINDITKELNSIYELKDFNRRRLYIRNNFFKNVIQNFAEIIQEDISNTERKLDRLNISCEQNINHSHLRFFCIGGIKNYEKSRFTYTNMRYKECLPEKMVLNIHTNTNNEMSELIKESSNLAQHKMEFDKKYITSLLENDSKKQVACLQKSYIHRIFSYIQDSNILFDTQENLLRSLVVISLNEENLNELNKVFYGEKNKIHSLLVQSANDSDSNIYSPYGYAKLSS